MRRLLASLAPLAAVAALALAGCSSAAITTDAEATAIFKEDTAKHYHGEVAENDNGGATVPVVSSGDGRGCTQTEPKHWSCTAYVYMNDGSERNYEIAGTIVQEATEINYEAHVAGE
jgi:hypothetical protein